MRALRVGPTNHNDARFFTSRAARDVAATLSGRIRFYEQGGRLEHPPAARIAEFTVGQVEQAWLSGDSVLAVLVLATHAEAVAACWRLNAMGACAGRASRCASMSRYSGERWSATGS